MFTGLVEETGIIKKIVPSDEGNRITIEAKLVLEDLANGSSIACNGVCLTVETLADDTFTIFAVPETLKLTNIGNLKEGNMINLERAVRADTRLGGHIVQGHVECMAPVSALEKHESYWDIEVELSSPYLVPKGSLAIDGISLTIHELKGNKIRFQIIPETLKKTNIPEWYVGYPTNIETDYLVKAIDNITRWREENPEGK